MNIEKTSVPKTLIVDQNRLETVKQRQLMSISGWAYEFCEDVVCQFNVIGNKFGNKSVGARHTIPNTVYFYSSTNCAQQIMHNK